MPENYQNLRTFDRDIIRQYHFFKEWQEYFQNTENIKTQQGSHFFYINNDADNVGTDSCIEDKETGERSFKPAIKMYVPLDLKHMHDGVEKLFDFVAENDIKHNSKVSERYRGDGVVIRVGNLEDAQKIADFVGEDEYLKEGLLPENPFMISHNGIGFAVDGSLSFNSTLTSLLGDYSYYCKISKENLNEKNVLDFKEWIEETYEQITNGNGLQEVKRKQEFSKRPFDDDNNPYSLEDQFISYMTILDYLKVSLNPEARFEDYCEFFSRFESTEYPTNLYNIYNREPLLDKYKTDEWRFEPIISPKEAVEVSDAISDFESQVRADLSKDEIALGDVEAGDESENR